MRFSTFYLLAITAAVLQQFYAKADNVDFTIELEGKQISVNDASCDCVRAPGSTHCFNYDPQLQATTLTEAVIAFPDLSVEDPSEHGALDEDDDDDDDHGRTVRPPHDGRTLGKGRHRKRRPQDRKCHGAKCRQCSRKLVDRLRQNKLLNDSAEALTLLRTLNVTTSAALFADRARLRQRQRHAGAQLPPANDECRRYNFIRKPKCANETEDAGLKSTIQQLIDKHPPPNKRGRGTANRGGRCGKKGKGAKGAKGPKANQKTKIKSIRPPIPRRFRAHKGKGRKRQKPIDVFRAATGALKRQKRENPEIGQTYEINCIDRGMIEDERHSAVSLCAMCWQWRVLPADYFPRYINELVCDDNTRCLAGYGMCKQRKKLVYVLKKRANSDGWDETPINVSTSCDCKVETGSPLIGFVQR